MPKIFISYRREDTRSLSGIIANRLAAAFGKSQIVLDVDNIPKGRDFRDYIKRELDSCDYLLAMIGKSWLSVLDETGCPRLENPNDWVRFEIEAALGRQNKIPVIPVLLENVALPAAEQLPDSLKELTYRQAHSIRPPADFDNDIDRLIQEIEGQERSRKDAAKQRRKTSRSQSAGPFRRPLVLGSSAIAVAIAVFAAFTRLGGPNVREVEDPSRAAKGPPAATSAHEESGIGGKPGTAGGQSPQVAVTSPPTAKGPANFDGTAAGQTRKDNGLGTTLVWIPPGDFTMGSPKDETDRYSSEDQVQVTLTNGFWLGQHEVTQSEWQRAMQTTPWSGKKYVKEGDDSPASYVSWDDAVNFCDKLTEQERGSGRLPEGWKYTLPTEAQWEYACRGGSKTRYSFGNDESELGGSAWFAKNAEDAGQKYAHTVGQKKANPFGLYDIHGNVWEWCSDYYTGKLAGGADPQGPRAGSDRASRGGGWSFPARDCRSATRGRSAPVTRGGDLGFRLAASSGK